MTVTRDGVHGAAPTRDATVGVNAGDGRRRSRRRVEQPMVPDATFESYYGRPILKPPVWARTDIAGYFFTGGLAGASSLLAAGAHLTGRRTLATRSKVVALGSIGLSTAALVNDLGVPSRFARMLRVAKPTSPMSVGSWLLAGYGPAAGVAAVTAVTGRFPRLGALATMSAAALGPPVASYTAVLIGDTAVPAWHDGAREMPFVFAGSAATAAGGVGLVVAPVGQAGPARRLAVLGAVGEYAASRRMRERVGAVGEVYDEGTAGRLLSTGQALTAGGLALALLGRRRRWASVLGGVALAVASALTRFGIFEAGMASARDPRYVVEPQRQRLAE